MHHFSRKILFCVIQIFLFVSCLKESDDNINFSEFHTFDDNVAVSPAEPKAWLNLSLKLLQNLANNNRENLVFSPTSIFSCLAMVYVGSNGNTKRELANALFENASDSEQIHNQLKLLQNDLQTYANQSNVTLDVMNVQFVHKKLKIFLDYYNDIQAYFNAKLFSIDVGSDTDLEGKEKNKKVADLVNRNVAVWTRGKVGKILDASSAINTNTRILIVNTIYFKSDWLQFFKPLDDVKVAFKCEISGKTTEKPGVQMMRQTSRDFLYFSDDENMNVEVLGIPYSTPSLHFFIFLPKHDVTLDELESKLTDQNFQQLVLSARKRQVEAIIPSFKISSLLPLKQSFLDLGFKYLFETADLTRLAANDSLYVSDILQSATMEVNEKGSEAAGATVAVIQARSAFNDRPLKFEADKPFLYAIVDKSRMNVLFLGHIRCP